MKQLSWALCGWPRRPSAWSQGTAVTSGTVYRCHGPPICTRPDHGAGSQGQELRTIEGAPITIVQTRQAGNCSGRAQGRRLAAREGRGEAESTRRTAPARWRRARLLESELQARGDALADMQREFNNGEPERPAASATPELPRSCADMRAQIMRKQEDIAAIKRETGKLQTQ
jgi:hypothetical protein